MKTSPASTFKIPHFLIALETGVVADPLALVKWPGSKQSFPSWERDHSMDSAVKSSVVWFFKRTAGLIGRERMTASLKKLGYADDTFDRDVTAFWLNGDLVVSPEEQMRFLTRLFRYELPVSRGHVDAVRAALTMPPGKITNAAGVHDFPLTWPAPLLLQVKTGNAAVSEERVSWLVGFIKTGDREVVFVGRVRSSGTLENMAGANLALRTLNAHPPTDNR
ncbi:MAG: penicillin-binding transpeptidase domain-containing protein [Vicinamibacteria bacterium]